MGRRVFAPNLEFDPIGGPQGHDLPLPVEGAGERAGPVAQRGSFFKTFVFGQHPHPVAEGSKERGGVGGDQGNPVGPGAGVRRLLECHRRGSRHGHGGERTDVDGILQAADVSARCDFRRVPLTEYP